MLSERVSEGRVLLMIDTSLTIDLLRGGSSRRAGRRGPEELGRGSGDRGDPQNVQR